MNRVVIWLSYRPARLHSLAELVPWNRFLGSLKVLKFGLGLIRALVEREGRDYTVQYILVSGIHS